MGRPPKSASRETRHALLNAALDVFSSQGYSGATMRDIASSEGIRDSAIYHYFPGKEALFGAILEEKLERRREVFAIPDGPLGDARSILERVGMKIIDLLNNSSEIKMMRVLMSEGARLFADGRLHEFARMARAPVVGMMQRFVQDGWLREA